MQENGQQTNKQKLPRRGKTGQLARLDKTRQDKARQGRAGQEQDTFNGNIDDELARDCKHKEIIKGANEEGNEVNRWGKLTNNQVTRWVGSRQLT